MKKGYKKTPSQKKSPLPKKTPLVANLETPQDLKIKHSRFPP